MKERGQSPTEIQASLANLADTLGDWGTSAIPRSRFPSAKPFGLSSRLMLKFLNANENNAGVHFASGGRGTQALEKAVVEDLGSLLGDDGAEGWLTSGSTESNITGLWLARQRLRPHGTPVVLYSSLAHDSVPKACGLLGLDQRMVVPVDSIGRIDLSALADLLVRSAQYGPPVVVATVGSTSTGSLDDVAVIARLLRQKENRYLHVDAALGGMVLPFSSPDILFDFRLQEVDSISMDLHKFGGCPLGVGAFMARAGSTVATQGPSGYAGVDDRTVLGSRPGSVAAAAWGALRSMGRAGYRRSIERCLLRKRDFLRSLSDDLSQRVVHEADVPLVYIKPSADSADLKGGRRIYFMPHLTRRQVMQMAAELGGDPR